MSKEKNLIKFYTSDSIIEINRILDALESHGIPFMLKDGYHSSVVAGFGNAGQDRIIYIEEKDLEKSKELINEIL